MFRKPKWWDKPITWGQSVKGTLIATGIGLAIYAIEIAIFTEAFEKPAKQTPTKGDPIVIRLTKEEFEKFSKT